MKIISHLLRLAVLPKTSFLIPLLDRQWKKNLTDSKCLRDFNVKNAILTAGWRCFECILKDWHRFLAPCEVLNGLQQYFPLKLRAPPAEAAVSPVGYERGSSACGMREDLISSAQSQEKWRGKRVWDHLLCPLARKQRAVHCCLLSVGLFSCSSA